MQLDPTKMKDWQIAEAAEENMKTVYQLGEEMGLDKEELLPYGHHVAKIDYAKVLDRLKGRPDGKYIDVTAITPTPLGEGKSTSSVGLMEGLGLRGKNVIGALRQPSGGPTFNIKGSAAGGGLAQVIPLSKFSLGLTGDINAIMNAHNLGMVALTARMQHESNYTDDELARRGRQAPEHPSQVRGIPMDHRLLRPGPEKYHPWDRRQDGRIYHAERFQHRCEFGDHGHPRHCQ